MAGAVVAAVSASLEHGLHLASRGLDDNATFVPGVGPLFQRVEQSASSWQRLGRGGALVRRRRRDQLGCATSGGHLEDPFTNLTEEEPVTLPSHSGWKLRRADRHRWSPRD